MRHHAFPCRILACALLLLTIFAVQGCASKRITGMTEPSRPGAEASFGARVARTAASQVGRPYRSGGESPQTGFDCSGLIYWAFRQHGITVPRITTDQARAGHPVSRSNLQPGDIVVFRAASGPNGLHTGIYTGQGNFAHSPNSRSKVRIDSLSTPYWDKTYLTARRIGITRAGR